MPLAPVQEYFNLENQVDRVRLLVATTDDRPRVLAAVAARLPAELTVQAPVDQTELADSILRPALAKAEGELGRRARFSCMLAALAAAAAWEQDRPGEAAALLADRFDVLERGGMPEPLMLAYRTGARMAMQLHRRHCREIDQDSLTVALRQLSLTESNLQRFLTAGQTTEPRREHCDLRRIASDVVALVQPSCNHKGVQVRFDPDGSAFELLADSDHLSQLLLNLLLNGIEAAGPGGWVAVDLTHRDASVLLRVTDSGPGIDDALRDRLFEPFATGKPEGIGLGLAIARKIAESHGGTIDYMRDERTTFEVGLPRARGESFAPHRPHPGESHPSVLETGFQAARAS